jgi:hypothetical protein
MVSLRAPKVTLSLAVGLVVVAAGVWSGIGPLQDNSFFTHLATGRLILDDGIPRTDPYTFTARGTDWVVQSWLPSSIYAFLESWGGPAAIRVFTGVLSGLLAAAIWLLTAPAQRLVPRLAVAGLSVVSGFALWNERPLMVGLVLLGAVMLAAEGRFDPRLLIPVGWVWANSHGSFPLGLAAALLLWAGTRLDGADTTTERRTTLWLTVGVVLGAIGPLGPRVLTFPLELILGGSEALEGVREWEAPAFESVGERAFLLFVVVAVLVLARRPSWRAALPLVVFVAAALVASRNQAPASIVLVPGVAWGMHGMGSLVGAERTAVARLLAVGAGAIAVFGLLVPVLAPTADELDDELSGAPHYQLAGYPVAAVSWMDQEGLLGSEHHLVSRDLVGNYLELLRGTDVAVFADDRFDMFPLDVTEDQNALINSTPSARGAPLQILEHYDADVVVWDTQRPLAQTLLVSSDWRVSYQDEATTVFQRR